MQTKNYFFYLLTLFTLIFILTFFFQKYSSIKNTIKHLKSSTNETNISFLNSHSPNKSQLIDSSEKNRIEMFYQIEIAGIYKILGYYFSISSV